MARVRTPARPEMIHENPVLAPLLVALLRESAKAIEAAAQHDQNGNTPVGAASSLAMATIITTWAGQIEYLHRPETETAEREPGELFRKHGGDDPLPAEGNGRSALADDPGEF